MTMCVRLRSLARKASVEAAPELLSGQAMAVCAACKQALKLDCRHNFVTSQYAHADTYERVACSYVQAHGCVLYGSAVYTRGRAGPDGRPYHGRHPPKSSYRAPVARRRGDACLQVDVYMCTCTTAQRSGVQLCSLLALQTNKLATASAGK